MSGALKQWVSAMLDESVRSLEWRRLRRAFRSGRLPLLYTLGVLATALFILPYFIGQGPGWSGGPAGSSGRASAHPGHLLLAVTALAAGLGSFLRAGYVWQEESRLRALEAWLLTRHEPGQVARTLCLTSAATGLSLVYPAALLGTWLSASGPDPAWWLWLCLLLAVLCAVAGGALGSVNFFVSRGRIPRRTLSSAGAVVALLCLLAVLRVESVENGWRRNWEEHPARIGRALGLLTPITPVLGVLDREWWQAAPARSLGVDVPPWTFALWYAAMLAAASGSLLRLAAAGYARYAADPEEQRPRPDGTELEEGQDYYWRGFSNPIWTRDIRTRLRSKETAEFIFFASAAIAAGAFVPLMRTAANLSDPLQTATAAREVFFWLSLTILALLALLAPGMTSESIASERQSGTLALLVASPLRPREILVGRLLGAVSVLLLLISPSIPLFGLCYLFHGASAIQVAQVLLLLLGVMVVTGFYGLAFSATMPRAGLAKFWGYALTALLVGIPGGALHVIVGIAVPDADLRDSLAKFGSWTLLTGAFFAYGTVILWGSAREQLEYLEA